MQTVAYINDAESLCKRIDVNMAREEMIRNIMEGLKPSIARYIRIMGNETLAELKKNVRKYEMIEFIVSGETPKSPFDIKTEFMRSNIQQINRDSNLNKPEIDKLRDEIENLKMNLQLFINSKSNEQNRADNPYNNHHPPHFTVYSRENNHNKTRRRPPLNTYFDHNHQPNDMNKYNQPAYPKNPTRNRSYSNN